ncbi:hypothetical protein Anapl_01684 [Anas platyrhynchos]|uniref:C-C motif chemokine 1 n=1 Tax=Anas platyrhynchos TaxID=8839 RepID=R0M199_ANAPL|nr:hypothetical protein Anapl_01684 [Anas platyrhynchos]
MKLFSLTLVALLLAAVWTESWGLSFRSTYSKCCYKFVKNISASSIRSFKYTLPNCSRRAELLQSGTAGWDKGLCGPQEGMVPEVPEQTEAEQRLGVKPPPPCTLFICASPLPARGASLTPGAGPSFCCLRPPSLPLHTCVQPLVALIKSPVLNWSET